MAKALRNYVDQEIAGLLYVAPGQAASPGRVILVEQHPLHPGREIKLSYASEPTLVYVTDAIREKLAMGKLRIVGMPEQEVPAVVPDEVLPEPNSDPILDPDTGEYVLPDNVEEPARRRGRGVRG